MQEAGGVRILARIWRAHSGTQNLVLQVEHCIKALCVPVKESYACACVFPYLLLKLEQRHLQSKVSRCEVGCAALWHWSVFLIHFLWFL